MKESVKEYVSELLIKEALFEENNNANRNRLVGLASDYFADLLGKREILHYKIVCDESNNTDEVINENKLYFMYSFVDSNYQEHKELIILGAEER